APPPPEQDRTERAASEPRARAKTVQPAAATPPARCRSRAARRAASREHRLVAMRVQVGDTRIFFEVIGTKLVPEGPTMRERPTMLLLHGGPGFDHSVLATTLAPLADVAQLVLPDHRGQGRSDPSSA